MSDLFETTIGSLVSDNKFFMCAVCFDDFNRQQNYPMEICKNNHHMCQICVKARAFVGRDKRRYKCSLCRVSIKISQIKKNAFILQIKEFIENLIGREEKFSQKYKEYVQNQKSIMQILLHGNQELHKEIFKSRKECEKLKQTIKNQQRKINQLKQGQQSQKKQSKDNNDKRRIDYSLKQNEIIKSSPQIEKKAQISKNSIFQSNLFNQSAEKPAEQNNFVPNQSLSKVNCEYKSVSEQMIPEEPISEFVGSISMGILSKMIQEGERIQQDLIKQSIQNKLKLKKSSQQLQIYKICYNPLRQQGKQYDEKEQDYPNKEQGRPNKKIHVDQYDRENDEDKQPQNKKTKKNE